MYLTIKQVVQYRYSLTFMAYRVPRVLTCLSVQNLTGWQLLLSLWRSLCFKMWRAICGSVPTFCRIYCLRH